MKARMLFVFAAVFGANPAFAANLADDPEILRIKGAAESAHAAHGLSGKYPKWNVTLWLAPDGRYVIEEVNGCSEGVFLSAEKGAWRLDGGRLQLAAQAKDAGGWAQPWEEPDEPVVEWLVVDGAASPLLYMPAAVDTMIEKWNSFGSFPGDMAAVKTGEPDDAAAEPRLIELLGDRLLAEPVVARITHVAGRASTALDDSSVGFEITIDRGTADGLAEDMTLYLLDAREYAYAFVREPGERTTALTLYVHPIDANDADAVPEVGAALSTRSPHAGTAPPRAFRLATLRALPAYPGALPDHRYWQGRVATDGLAPTIGQRLWQGHGSMTAKVLDVGARDALVLVRACDGCDVPKVGSRLFDTTRPAR